ncbi:hypothetical protein NLX83_24215 [Allokutzneria sp. A3M-2-11 16]|uniref:hypothetical protein n=1 Tax=Allokutzneria sp. A3M-2-11 16 TaxID=2962043 RepID=UPI0020B7D56D|nr:hypothetical protein [Allokutzneria sp. A3M-2-11 16]MCP3802378.1 hypothetical protein [Allokutzneria sp. A3M-2-11 16]
MATPRIRATDAGRTLDDPSEEQLHDLLADMNLRCNFVVVERLSADPDPERVHYIQVALRAEPNYGSYQVEYREGGPSDHFQTTVPRTSDWGSVYDRGFDKVVEVVCDWAAGRTNWRTALAWEPWDPTRSADHADNPVI